MTIRSMGMAWAAVALGFGATLALADGVKDHHVEAELVCETTTVQPGTPFWIGLWLKPETGWHTYWLNPGDAGMGPYMEWLVADGFSVEPFLWPCPQRISEGDITSYGYEGNVLLLARVTPAKSLKLGSSYSLGGRVKWLACHDVCLPGQADLNISVTTATNEPALDRSRIDLFANARSRLPVTPDNWTFQATFTDERFILSATPAGPLGHPIEDVYFFPENPELVAHGKPQLWNRTEGACRLLIPRSIYEKALPRELVGIAYAAEGWDPDGHVKALAIRVPVEKIYK